MKRAEANRQKALDIRRRKAMKIQSVPDPPVIMSVSAEPIIIPLPGHLPPFNASRVAEFQWGESGRAVLETELHEAYEEVVFWKKKFLNCHLARLGRVLLMKRHAF
jgi:hypothetical protein